MNDPRDRINMLRQYMEAAKEFGIGGSGFGGGGPYYAAHNAEIANNARRMWAERMMNEGSQQQSSAPDFFGDGALGGGSPAAKPYVAAERFQPTQPMRGGMGPSMRPEAMNYLARLMGRTNG